MSFGVFFVNRYFKINFKVSSQLRCNCLGYLYTGTPYCHMLAVYTKESDVNISALFFNQRWRLDFYRENDTEEAIYLGATPLVIIAEASASQSVILLKFLRVQ